jgi:hypothetical protein
MTRYHLNGPEPDRLQIATANALAGSVAASFAAAITTPLDVVIPPSALVVTPLHIEGTI